MNPPNRHIPTLVFILGAGCLVYSMMIFFRPSSSLTPQAVLPAPMGKEAERLPVPEPTRPVAPVAAEPASVSSDWLAQQTEYAQKTARAYLRNAGLEMALPENMQVGEISDGAYKVLLGASGSGRIGLFLFSVKGKHTTDKLREYYEEFFKADLKLQPGGKGVPYNSRGGMKMTMFKGSTQKSEEYLAYVFKNESSGAWHILFLTDRELGKHPAKVRSLVDSIKPGVDSQRSSSKI